MSHPLISPRKLIEVALPLDAINAAVNREWSLSDWNQSSLREWWAQRPFAAARAVIFSQLVHDPEDLWRCQNPGAVPSTQVRGHWTKARARLFRIIEDLVLWENTTNGAILKTARDEIRKAWRETCGLNRDHPQAKELFNPDKMPGLHDLFAGGGTIPREAQRIGLEAFASDLNPAAVLINKAITEIPPGFAGQPPVHSDTRNPLLDWSGAKGLAEEVRRYGAWMRDEAFKRIGHLYPPVGITPAMVQDRPDLETYQGKQLTVIAWLWARTVKSPNPAFSHVDVPLASTFILSSKPGEEAYVEPITSKNGYEFTVKVGQPPAEARGGTKASHGGSFTCLMSRTPIHGDYIKTEAVAGRMGQKLMAMVAEDTRGRVYLRPTAEHTATAMRADPRDAASMIDVTLAEDPRNRLCLQNGLTHFDHLFTPRQLVALTTFSDLVGEAREKILTDALGLWASRPPVASDEEWRPGRPRSREEAPSSRPHTAVHSRGYLPHWEAGATSQAITFRLADSLPQHLLETWKHEGEQLDDTQAATHRRKKIEAALDQGIGACHLRRPEIASLVENALLHFDGARYDLHAWTIMPNHVHVLITPRSDFSLSSITHSWKSYTAKLANKQLGLTGAFWQEEYFDRMIRDDNHWNTALAYIEQNPVKAGLCTRAEDWPFGSAYQRALAPQGVGEEQ